MSAYALHQGDCIAVMESLPDASVDLVLVDPPYGTTQSKWDSVIPFDEMWRALKRIATPSAAFIFTASQPFTSALIMSNPKMFRHEWIWIKNRGSNFANTVREPMKEHESVVVFSRGKWTYNRIMQPRTGSGLDRVKYDLTSDTNSELYRKFDKRRNIKLPDLRVPSSWQKFNTVAGKDKTKHPTQKPVELLEYMIRTYSNPGETVLDFTMGSGSTGVAAVNLDRRFVGIEKDPDYFEIATERLDGAQRKVAA